MAYADSKQNKAVAIGSAVLIQAGIGAALFTGLVVTTTGPHRDPPIKIIDVAAPVPPEPVEPPPPEPRAEVALRTPVAPPLHVPTVLVPTPPVFTMAGTTEILPPPSFDAAVLRVEPPIPPAPPPPPAASLSRGLKVRGDQGDWFPRDAYPAAARRAGAEGRVGVSVDVDARGRVSGCRVVASSGNEDLDGATCRLATRNGRFAPALNAAGEAVPATITLRPVRWTLEE